MRNLLIALLLSTAFAAIPTASAAQCPPMCVSVGVTPTLPSSDCGDCGGVSAHAGTVSPGCADCGDVGAAVGVQHENGETTVSAKVCRSGFFYICIVDEEITV